MPDCPKYRLRLFLSVDLVGSTAFKARFGDSRENANDPNPVWVAQIRHFYRDFPLILANKYEKQRLSTDRCERYVTFAPKVWKAIGDEIIFCCRLYRLEHLAVSISGFLRSLEEYGLYLDKSGKHLDVKGSGWIASFPAPNVTVEVAGRGQAENVARDQLDENYEAAADQDPINFDFLGKEIDSGFRTAKNASADRFTASLELAWLLAEASHLKVLNAAFWYHGRQTLKGVIKDRPYPIVTLDAERSDLRREVHLRERAVTRESAADPLHLRDFPRSFMLDEEIDLPVLPRAGGELDEAALPQSYRDFERAWKATAEETRNRGSAERAAGEAGNFEQAEGSEMPPSVEDALAETVSNIPGSFS